MKRASSRTLARAVEQYSTQSEGALLALVEAFRRGVVIGVETDGG